MSVVPNNVNDSQVEIWFQDETRVGQQGSLSRIWAKTGTRPRVVRQQQFLSSYIYGAVCPQRKVGAALVMPYANSYCMTQLQPTRSRWVVVYTGSGGYSKEILARLSVALASEWLLI